MAALSVGGRNQLVLVDTRSPANVDVFEIVFESSGSSLGLSLLQNFSLMCACLSVTVFTVGQQLFLAFPLPCNESLAIHWLVTVANSPLFEHHRTLTLPRVSQVSTFKLAQQVYLAVNGDKSYVLRVTESGDFIAELSLDYANEWLAIPVNSYRDDVALFSRSANRTELFVWAGTMKGFNFGSEGILDSISLNSPSQIILILFKSLPIIYHLWTRRVPDCQPVAVRRSVAQVLGNETYRNTTANTVCDTSGVESMNSELA
ncbi:hypothetical protein J6590_006987 [Homalodisca vitripennis]|nr:hypothetical protein J6590_006987 [Homalodisca vitripennis]